MKFKLSREATGIIVPKVDVTGPVGTAQVNMILDTGAAYTIIDRGTVKKLGYDISGSTRQARIITANGGIHVPLIRIQKMSVNGVWAFNVPVIIHDIPEIVDVSGLLGLSFLKHFKTTVDFKTLSLTIE